MRRAGTRASPPADWQFRHPEAAPTRRPIYHTDCTGLANTSAGKCIGAGLFQPVQKPATIPLQRGEVVHLGIHPFAALAQEWPDQIWLGLQAESQEIIQVAFTELGFLTNLHQPLASKLANCLQHAVAHADWNRYGFTRDLSTNCPSRSRICSPGRLPHTTSAASSAPASGKNRKAQQQRAFLLREQVVGPVAQGFEVRCARGRSVRLPPVRGRKVSSNRSAICVGAQQAQPRRGQLDRQRDPVQPPADAGGQGGVRSLRRSPAKRSEPVR